MLFIFVILPLEGSIVTSPRHEIHQLQTQLPFLYHPLNSVREREYTPNWHDQLEILQCCDGEGYVRCDGEYVPFTKGTVVVANPSVVHVVGSKSRALYRCLIIDNSFFHENGVHVESLSFEQNFHDPAFFSVLEDLAADYANLEPTNYLRTLSIRTHVLKLVHLLCRDHTARQVSHATGSYVTLATEYLKNNLSSHIGLDDVAAAVGISKFYLARQFKALTGKSIVQTLNMMRCTEARRLIQSGSSVSEAAAASGFENLSYFSSTFKKTFGKLPSDYIPKSKK